MRINTDSCAAVCSKEEISHRHNSQAQRQSATKCLQNHVYQGVPEVGSELGTGNIYAQIISASTRKGNEHSYCGLEGPRTSPRDCVSPACQSTQLAAVFCQCAGQHSLSPLVPGDCYFSTCFLADRQEISKDHFSARQKGTRSYSEMMSVDLQLIFACCLFPMAAYLCPSRV